MKNIHLNNRSWLNAWAVGRRWFYSLPYVALIKRFRLLRLVLLVILGVVALSVVVRLLYFETSAVTSVAERPITLQAEGLDELEVWLEERNTEWENEIVNDQRRYFER